MDTLNQVIKEWSLPHYFQKSIHFLYVHLFKLRGKSEDDRRQESILNFILWESIGLISLLDLSIAYNYLSRMEDYEGIPFTDFSLIDCFFLFLLFLSRKGWLKTSSYLLIASYFLAVTWTEYHWGMGVPAGLLSYALIIIISSILISGRFGILISLLIAAILISFGYHESLLGIVPLWKTEPTLFNTSFQYAIIILSMTVVSWLYTREMDRSLKRARVSEKTLKEQNESLEEIVDERTKELKQVQAEKVSQLYRFAEFGRLSSGIFHDLINPLSIVSLNISELEGSYHPDIPDIKERLERAVSASKRMDRFVQVVKKQIQTTEFSAVFSLNDQIEEVLVLLNYTAIKQGITLEFQATEEIETYGNLLKFQQIISNLISNAIDAYDGLTLPARRKLIKISLRREKETALVEVKDNGGGISKDVIEKIFDPFFTTKSTQKGIGLGLSTTKEAIEKSFGGTIKIESVEGKGSVFTVVFPIVKSG